MIKAVLFDFFDVIRQDAFHAWMKNHKFTRTDKPGEISRKLDVGLIDVEEFFVELSVISGQSLKEIKNEFAENEQFNDDVIGFIGSIKHKYKIVLISNSEGKYLRGVLESKGITSLFDELIISAEIKLAKPDKEIFEYVLKKIGLKADEVIFIDDQERNVVVAQELGMQGIVFRDVKQLLEEFKLV